MTNLNEFAAWQAEQPESRSIKIEIEPARFSNGGVQVWVYDYDLREGQRVTTAAEIDIEGVKQQRELAQLADLKAKYEVKEVV